MFGLRSQCDLTICGCEIGGLALFWKSSSGRFCMEVVLTIYTMPWQYLTNGAVLSAMYTEFMYFI